jgi:hypothetical protein
MVPTAVTVGFKSMGPGVVCWCAPSPKTSTEHPTTRNPGTLTWNPWNPGVWELGAWNLEPLIEFWDSHSMGPLVDGILEQGKLERWILKLWSC